MKSDLESPGFLTRTFWQIAQEAEWKIAQEAEFREGSCCITRDYELKRADGDGDESEGTVEFGC